MKKFVAVVIIAGLLFSFAVQSYADGPMDKLKRGATNLALSPLELPNAVWSDWEMGTAEAFFEGATWGVLQGVFNIAKRAVVGTFEIITFPVPFPKDYKPILDEPAFFE
ncbi:MAG: exosortase system-associated protein, TIGR04073 family [Candidatus Omnitrophota bacterium]